MAGENLKKLMGKLKEDKKKKQKPIEEKKKDADKDVVEEDLVKAEEETKVTGKDTEEQQEKDAQELVEHEVAVLQNDGVFRRELLGVLRELVDVHKVITQVLLDLKEWADK